MTQMERDQMVIDAIACPRCGRGIGNPCVTRSWRIEHERHPHVVREKAAERAAIRADLTAMSRAGGGTEDTTK